MKKPDKMQHPYHDEDDGDDEVDELSSYEEEDDDSADQFSFSARQGRRSENEARSDWRGPPPFPRADGGEPVVAHMKAKDAKKEMLQQKLRMQKLLHFSTQNTKKALVTKCDGINTITFFRLRSLFVHGYIIVLYGLYVLYTVLYCLYMFVRGVCLLV